MLFLTEDGECLSLHNTGTHDWWHHTKLWRECFACGIEEYREIKYSEWKSAKRIDNTLVDAQTEKTVYVRL